MNDADAVVERVVRESYGRLVAYLSSVTGDITEAEDAFSEALAAALATWPSRGIPDRPDSWLVSVARRNIIGAARRRDVAARAMPELARMNTTAPDPAALDEGHVTDTDWRIPDRRLQLMFACSHPAIEPTMRSALILQTVLGLDAARIASAFLVAPATMGQRLVRTKSKIRHNAIAFEIPDDDELAPRLSAVLDAIYAAYGTGWDDHFDTETVGAGLADEALRLGRLVTQLLPEQPEAHGLLALMLHSAARVHARRDDAGSYVPLEEQDVARWSRERIQEAEAHLDTAFRAGAIGRYQLHAVVQSLHNRRALTGRTDWVAIAAVYDGLISYDPTIGTHVARAAAHNNVHGADRALAMLDDLPVERTDNYQPYHAVRAHCLACAGRTTEARTHAARAVALSADPAVQDWLRRTYLDDRATRG